jgi:hypothetical protein
MTSPIVAGESVPFTLWYSGQGSYGLPYGTGMDPILHLTPNSDVWMNVTNEGHRYHPGAVVHGQYESNGKIWLYTIGAGTGPNPARNVSDGKWIFGGMHLRVRSEVLNQQLVPWRLN